MTIRRDEILADNLCHLLALVQCEIIDSPYDGVAELIEGLWRENPQACQDMLVDSIPYWKNLGDEIVDEVFAAAHQIKQASFLNVVEVCTQTRGIPRKCKTRLLTLLIQSGRADAIARYERAFRRRVEGIQTGRIECSEDDVMSAVHAACRLRIASLLPELIRLEHECKPRVAKKELWPYALHSVQAAITCFQSGLVGLRRIASDDRAESTLRSECVYCIGCIGGQADLAYLRSLYWGQFAGDPFEVRRAIIDTVAYIGTEEEVTLFLVEVLEERIRTKKLRSWWKTDRYLFGILEAAYFAAKATPELIRQLGQVLQARDTYIAACAWVVLEKLGHAPSDAPAKARQKVQSAKSLMASKVSSDVLMAHRPDRPGLYHE